MGLGQKLTFGSLATVGTLKVARVEFNLRVPVMSVLRPWRCSCGRNNAELMVDGVARAGLRPLEVVRDSL